MATTSVSSHSRGGNKTTAVKAYSQNRKTGKPRNKKAQTSCQQMIAKVIKLENKHNATPKQLRTDPLWRNYVCNCTESTHHKWITGQEGLSESGSGVKAESKDYSVAVGKKKGIKTFKARIIDVPARTVQSRCGVSIFIPAHKRTLQGKSLAYILATKS